MDLASLGIALADFLSWTPGKLGLSNYVVFSAASGVFGSCLVILDVCLVGAGPDSALGLTHGWRRTPTIVAIWFIAPLIAAALGMVARIFEPTPLAAVLVAVSWRTFLIKLLAKAKQAGYDDVEDHEG